MDVPIWVWGATIAGILALLVFDFFAHVRTPHEPSLKEAGGWSIFYVVIALIFGAGLWAVWGHDHGIEYFAGYVTEKSLSVDNLFVFVIIMASFDVPKAYQQKVLLVGVVIALILRTIFIALGAAAIENFSWVFYIFGLFLIYTAYSLASASHDEEEEYEPNFLVKAAQKYLPATDEYDGNKLTTKINGKRLITPMLIVMIAIGATDILFALDSIPAIYGLTREPFIVFTANAFALLGLIQLYFLLGGLLNRLVYLSFGLAVILGFIGIKLIIHALHTNELPFINGGQHVELVPEIPIWLSLSVILGILVITTVASLMSSHSKAG
ncbi:TerC family protein [Salinisphaera japonica]|uniref:Tellurium resistance protein TerC n=1 Tax=Salinisphaera japonica YTM-1 TaxID=1209778 RepID=A0A423PPN7_9GAMM|nr:TerC family protein [Salinisphaera japonica]ROO27553.1 tellurium resistance protein TerC [Salinisphaera japonica YTM-1]